MGPYEYQLFLWNNNILAYAFIYVYARRHECIEILFLLDFKFCTVVRNPFEIIACLCIVELNFFFFFLRKKITGI